MLNYVSTRGKAPRLNFAETTLAGLATDGGLYVPESFPKIGADELAEMPNQSYQEIAWRVILPFVGEEIPSEDLLRLLKASYQDFNFPEIAPITRLEKGLYVQELFHGPTLAFKDIALQFLGQVFDYLLSKKSQRVTILGATSGDTGSAAIEACRDRENMDVFILHPEGRVSDVQRRQMTTVPSPNVFNIAIDGSFDDCQAIVKTLFNDREFRQEVQLSAVNSINWARILAQVVYYLYGGLHVQAEAGKAAAFSVPTGNFGNVYAGYVARNMGLEIEKLIVATNSNDILHRFFTKGVMQKTAVVQTLSPSMDIQISSNFERLLFDFCGQDGERIDGMMSDFQGRHAFEMPPEVAGRFNDIFASARLDDTETLTTMKSIYEKHDYLADPHTAVALGAALAYRQENPDVPVIAIATAHPAKFPDAVEKATGVRPALPSHLADLFDREERSTSLPADPKRVADFMRQNIRQ